ncbi:Glutathione S-transferase [Orchesella cincta]|uniref:glutathione transferase n=1 Tax=Orchesella cincta TaxID=48709 RepID=A0A1D2MVG1_ORCCI|nr:Glutathione S-transferase [Orchesella cincta]
MGEDKYKLIYFNVMARAEPIRLIFAAAGVQYEDYRLEGDNWDTEKTNYPWGKLPVLEINGEVLAESTAICRYLASKFSLVGSTDLEAAKCDEYVDAIMDCRSHWRSYYWESDAAKKEELKNILLNVQVPFYYSKFEKIVEASKGDYLLGTNYTWADLHIAHTVSFIDKTVKPGLLDDYPKLKKFSETVFNIPKVKAWIEKRPKTER